MKRQKTLNRFLGLVEEEESNSEEEGQLFEPSKHTVPQYWTSVKDRSQLNVKQVRTFDIEEDVAAFINEDDYKKDRQNEEKEPYLFDTDSFKLNNPTLVPANHTPSVEELKQLGQLVSRLRNQFETRGLQLLQ